MTNDELVGLLHQLVDNLGPILNRLDQPKTVPVLRVTLNQADGPSMVLMAGIEFEKPASSKTLPLTIDSGELKNFNMGRVLE